MQTSTDDPAKTAQVLRPLNGAMPKKTALKARIVGAKLAWRRSIYRAHIHRRAGLGLDFVLGHTRRKLQ